MDWARVNVKDKIRKKNYEIFGVYQLLVQPDVSPKKFLGFGFGFGYKIFWVLGMGIGFGYKNFWVLGMSFGFGYKIFWVLGLGIKFFGYWVWV